MALLIDSQSLKQLQTRELHTGAAYFRISRAITTTRANILWR